MTEKLPLSYGLTSSSTPLPSADDSTSCAAASPSVPQSSPTSSPAEDGWTRSGADEIRRGLYRIGKAYVARKLHEPSPIYHAFHVHAFLGAFPSADDAKAHCHRHEAQPC